MLWYHLVYFAELTDMETISADRLNEWLLLVAALVVSMAIFYTLEKLVKALIVPLAMVAIALIVAKAAFGISPDALWHDAILLIRRLATKLA